MNQKNKIIHNTSFVGIGSIVSKLLALFLLFFVSRLLGPSKFGAYNFVMVFAGYFAIFADFGTTQVLVIKGAQEPQNRSFIFWQLSVFRLIAGVVVAILITLLSFVITTDPLNRKAIFINAISIPIGLFVGLLGAFFISDQKHSFKVIFEIAIAAFTTAASILFLYFGFGYVTLLLIGLAGTFFSLLIQYKYLRSHGLSKYCGPDINVIINLLKIAAPFGIIFFLANLFNRIDIAIIEWLKGTDSVGMYSAAYRLMNNVAFIPGAVTSAIFPVMSILCKESNERLTKLINIALGVLISIGLFIAGLVFIWGEKAIIIYYGQMYAGAIRSTLLLGWAVPIMFANSILIHLFYAKEWKKQVLIIMIMLLCVNVILNILLISTMDIAGAAITTIVCESLQLFIYFLIINKKLPGVVSGLWVSINIPVATLALTIILWLFLRDASNSLRLLVTTTTLIIGFTISFQKNNTFKMLFNRS